MAAFKNNALRRGPVIVDVIQTGFTTGSFSDAL